MKSNISRGDMFYADLSPVIGSEQGGIRPVLVVQNDIGNIRSSTVIVAAITSKYTTKAELPTHYYITAKNGLDKNSVVLLEQIRTIDKKRLRDYIGVLDKETMQGINEALAISVGIRFESK